jgi:hypothetical protein
MKLADWSNGRAGLCKSSDVGSTPTSASNFMKKYFVLGLAAIFLIFSGEPTSVNAFIGNASDVRLVPNVELSSNVQLSKEALDKISSYAWRSGAIKGIRAAQNHPDVKELDLLIQLAGKE